MPKRLSHLIRTAIVATLLSAGAMALYFWQVWQPRERARLVAQVERELVTSLRIRALAIQEWFLGELRDAELVTRLPAVNRALDSRGAPSAVAEGSRVLEAFLQSQHLARVVVLDRDLGVVLHSNGSTAVAADLLGLAGEVLTTGQPNIRLTRSPAGEQVLFAAPFAGGRGVAVLVEDAQRWLYAYLQTWPVLGPSSEVLLVRRMDDSIRYLGPLRHDTVRPLTMGLGLDDLPGAESLVAFGGGDSFTTYRDYRGEQVYAAGSSLDFGGIGLVVKRDLAVIETELTERAANAASLSGLLLLVVVALAVLVTLALRQADLRAAVANRTQDLERTNQHLETVQMVVSHDLRGPLQIIGGYSDLLATDYGSQLDEDGRALLAGLQKGVASLNRQILDLLNLGRARRTVLQPVDVDMTQLVAEVVAEVRAEHGTEVAIEVGSLPPCRGDRPLLRQLWVNLLGNSVKFAGRGGAPVGSARVSVAGHRQSGRAIYTVRDNGPGFPAEDAARIFESYTRAANVAGVPGHGVGLAIVRQVVERHDGTVRAESPPEGGALFTVTLPEAPASPR